MCSGQRRRLPAEFEGDCRGRESGIRETAFVGRREFGVSGQFLFSRKHGRAHSLPSSSVWSVKAMYCTSVEVRAAGSSVVSVKSAESHI